MLSPCLTKKGFNKLFARNLGLLKFLLRKFRSQFSSRSVACSHVNVSLVDYSQDTNQVEIIESDVEAPAEPEYLAEMIQLDHPLTLSSLYP